MWWNARALSALRRHRRRTEEELRGSEAQLAAILDHAHAMVYVVDRHGRFQFINRRWQPVSGLTNEQCAPIKFTPPDGSITVRSSNVDDNGRVRVEVADTGAGIAPNVLVSCSTRSSRAKRTARTAGRPRGWGWPPRGGLRRPVSASNRLTPLPRRAPAGED